MKNEKNASKKFMTLGVFGFMALLGMSMVFAYQGDYSAEGPNYSEDRHTMMTQAFGDLDYEEWVALMMEDGRHPKIVDLVTEENFAKFVEAHEAGKSGDFERASGLRAELGLGDGMGSRDGSGFGGEKGMKRGSGMKGQHGGEYPYAN